MKKLLSLALASTLASSLACAQNFTRSNVDQAQAIIAAAVEAHGGTALTDDLHTLTIELERSQKSRSPISIRPPGHLFV